MTQFSVYANTNKSSKSAYPYLVSIQSDLLDDLSTTVVIPLAPVRLAGKAAISRLCPVLDFDGASYVLLTQQMAGVPTSTLGSAVGDVSAYRDAIVAAMDFLISGV